VQDLLDKLDGALDGAKTPVVLVVRTGGEPADLGEEFERTATAAVQGRDHVLSVRVETTEARPSIDLLVSGRLRCRFHARPTGLEARSFTTILSWLTGASSAGNGELSERLRSLGSPASLVVYIGEHCPHCPRAVLESGRLVALSDAVTLTVVDAQRFHDLASRHAVTSVPYTVLDTGLGLTGVVESKDLVSHLMGRETQEHLHQVFVSMIESSRTSEAALAVRAAGGTDHFLSAWRRSTLSTRMALMLISEKALEADPVCMDPCVAGLVEILRAPDASLRGDTADLLGQIGHPLALEPLRGCLTDPNPDVVEIVRDAIAVLDRSSRINAR
jgi:hypothetical protein